MSRWSWDEAAECWWRCRSLMFSECQASSSSSSASCTYWMSVSRCLRAVAPRGHEVSLPPRRTSATVVASHLSCLMPLALFCGGYWWSDGDYQLREISSLCSMTSCTWRHVFAVNCAAGGGCFLAVHTCIFLKWIKSENLFILHLHIDLTCQIPPRGPASSIQLVCHKPVSCNPPSVTQQRRVSSSLLGIRLLCVPTLFQRRAFYPRKKKASCLQRLHFVARARRSGTRFFFNPPSFSRRCSQPCV